MFSFLKRRFPQYLIIMALFLAVGCSRTPSGKLGESENFSIVILPDTQFYSLNYPDTYLAQTQWIAKNIKRDNIRFVAHVGDIVHNNTIKEWEAADRAHQVLDGLVPYSVTTGNHDVVALPEGKLTRDTTRYNQYFGPSRFAARSWYGGHLGETNENNYCLFEAGKRKFLVVSLEFAPTDAALQWAGQVIASHPDRQTIVVTHIYMSPNGRVPGVSKKYELAGNSGEQIWNKLIRKHQNIFLVVSGHIAKVACQTSLNDAGGEVHEMLVDYQNLPNGGNGWLRILRFIPKENKIDVLGYSPLLDLHNEDPAHSFPLSYEMTPEQR